MRRTVKRVMLRPIIERACGVEWYPASFACARMRVIANGDGTLTCRPQAPLVRVRAEWWRSAGFRLLWAWRYGRPWRESLLSETTDAREMRVESRGA